MQKPQHKYCNVCRVKLTEKNSYIKTTTNWLCLPHYKIYRKKKNPLTGLTHVQKYELKNNKTEKRKRQLSEIAKRMYNKYPEKWKARAKIRYAVKTGKIIKPGYCSSCLSENVKIEAHHEDYSKPLEVLWMCHQCHENHHHN